MNPLTRNRLMLHSTQKVHRLEADLERMTDVLALIVRLAENRPPPAGAITLLAQIAKLGRAGLAGATPPAAELARETG